jgi:hypothetical protein
MNADDMICYDGGLGTMTATEERGVYVWQRQARPAPTMAADADIEIELEDDTAPKA